MLGVVEETRALPREAGLSRPSGEDAFSIEDTSHRDGRFSRFRSAMETPKQHRLNEYMILPAMPPPERGVWLSRKSTLIVFMLTFLFAFVIALNPRAMISRWWSATTPAPSLLIDDDAKETRMPHEHEQISYTYDGVSKNQIETHHVNVARAYDATDTRTNTQKRPDALETSNDDGNDSIDSTERDADRSSVVSNQSSEEKSNSNRHDFELKGQREWYLSSFHEVGEVSRDVLVHRIQISMLKQRKNVDVVMKEFSKKFDTLLQGKEYNVEEVEMKGVLFHVVYVGPFEDEEAAAEACREMQRQGSDCVVASS